MRTVVDGEVNVHYGQIYVHSEGGDPFDGDLTACFAGQRNGLCGAAVPGTLFLITGLHTGKVGFTAEVHDTEPPGTGGEDVVEAPFRAEGAARLVTWGGGEWWDLELSPGDYRVRYSGSGMDAGRDRDTRLDGEPALDRYLLQFWPAPPAPDIVVRQRSAIAAYWHGFARELPTSEEFTAAKARMQEAREREAAEALAKDRHERLLREWGGSLPPERILNLPHPLRELAKQDRGFVADAIDAAPEVQHALARRLARHAFTLAGLDTVAWIAEGLRALDEGRALPPPFGDWTAAWDRLLSDPDVPHTLVRTPDGRHDNALQQAMAFPAIFAAAKPDPVQALSETLSAALVTQGGDSATLFAWARAALAELTSRTGGP
ncbi:hypothetical protein VA596_24645 [Amycolatopsis sp., V23-08]|uniref:Uncharacterized protein n=1 Tax=Amycolatopsis heterodermiae TaxID=3110235 RepID=A0ABU5R9E4_9PSEU|nr:hypothetical protein [Amycolatopsis sp., V23-08]MEA5362748.1 hypothetical protein [Amycolatopsis sp., V23-08]